jgi:K+-transporting ATPase ATPase B chain
LPALASGFKRNILIGSDEVREMKKHNFKIELYLRALGKAFQRFSPFTEIKNSLARKREKEHAQANSTLNGRGYATAKRLKSASNLEDYEEVPFHKLKKGDLILVKEGEQIPLNGEVDEGAAFVDESAITGESAPVIRESGGDRSAVTGGTIVVSDWLVIRIAARGECFGSNTDS